MSHSITRRLLISNLLILLGFLGLAGIALDRAFTSSNQAATRERLQANLYTLLAAADEDERGRIVLPELLPAPAFNQPDSGLYAVVRGNADDFRWQSASLIGQGALQSGRSRPGQSRFRLTPTLALLDQGIAWETLDGTAVDYSLTVAVDRATMDSAQRGFRTTLWGWLGGVATLLTIVQLLLARWGLRPLRAMSAALRRLERGESAVIEGPVARELEGLASSLNELIEHNRIRQERVRHSLADLAHSLKTPLAVLRGGAEQTTDPVLGRLLDDQTRRIDEIVGYQRQRAAVAGGSGVTRPIRPTPIIRRICAGLQKIHQSRALNVDLQLPSGLALRADEGDLFELFGNLLENAFRHARTLIRIDAAAINGRCRITVEDDGPGFAEADRARLLRRGVRADQQHSGEGIGLAVVAEIVRQYAGELELGATASGGARVAFTLPSAGGGSSRPRQSR